MNIAGRVAIGVAGGLAVAGIAAAVIHSRADNVPTTTTATADANSGAQLATRPKASSDDSGEGALSSTTIGMFLGISLLGMMGSDSGY
jgi:hypothetical protein